MAIRTALVAAALCAAMPLQAKTTAADVLKQVEKSFAQVKDYKADLLMSVDSPQLHIKDSKAAVYFKRPDKIKVEAKQGFAMVPTQAVPGDQARWIQNNFNAAYAGEAPYKGQAAHVLTLSAKTPSVAPSTKVWIDKRRWIILGTQSMSQGMTMKSDWSYSLVDGKYWLPSQVKIEMTGIMSGAVFEPHKGNYEPPKTGKGTAVVKITNYKVNKGIPDSVFKNTTPAPAPQVHRHRRPS